MNADLLLLLTGELLDWERHFLKFCRKNMFTLRDFEIKRYLRIRNKYLSPSKDAP